MIQIRQNPNSLIFLPLCQLEASFEQKICINNGMSVTLRPFGVFTIYTTHFNHDSRNYILLNLII